MTQLIKISAAQTMTSRDIADLVESRHDHVKTSIERLAKSGTISHPAMRYGAKSANGVSESVYIIGKRDSYVIVAQLSPAFTARLVDRWQELEFGMVAPAPAIPTSLSAALRLAADQAETIEIIAATPAVEFVEKYVDSTGLKSFRQVCKLLGANEAEFRIFLNARHIMYRLGGEWVPYSQHIDAGRFVVKAGTADSGHAFNSAKFTPKGVEWVAGEFARFQVREMEVAA